jgi:hypothetical protein
MIASTPLAVITRGLEISLAATIGFERRDLQGEKLGQCAIEKLDGTKEPGELP